MEKRYIPNVITGFRLGLTPLLLWWILAHNFDSAFILAIAMSVSDAFDGGLAKGLKWRTRFGEFFDPLADKVMVMGAFLALGVEGFLPGWLVVIVLFSGACLIAGGVFSYFRFAASHVNPPWISKINTVLQLFLIMLILFYQSRFSVGITADIPAVINGLIAVTAISTVLSFLVYVFAFREYSANIKSR